jgi:hypothetical protein
VPETTRAEHIATRVFAAFRSRSRWADVLPYPFDETAGMRLREQRMFGRGVNGVIWIGTMESQIIE